MRQAVHVLDPCRVAQVEESNRSCFNPLDTQDVRTIDEANMLANAIVVVRPTRLSWSGRIRATRHGTSATRTMVRYLLKRTVSAAH